MIRNTNGLPPIPLHDPPTLNEAGVPFERFEQLVHNAWQFRDQFLGRFLDPRRDIDAECGYPDALLANFYRTLYDRTGIAERVVQLMPKECWRNTPTIYEDESAKNATPFEEDWDNLGQTLSMTTGKKKQSWFQDEKGSIIWSYLLRADILSGIGTFGGILVGIGDGRLLEQPADGSPPDGAPKDVTGVSDLQTKDIYGGTLPNWLEQPLASTMGTDAQYFGVQFSPMQPVKPAKHGKAPLTFLRVFDESLVQVVQYEASMYSPRFGQPIMYLITLNDPRQPHTGIGLPLATVRVHWSRFVHIAENNDKPSEVFAKPRMQPVVNDILDYRKVKGGAAEMYWRAAFPGLSLETHPQLGGDVAVNKADIRQMMQNYYQSLNRWISLMGMTAKSLAPQVSDPTPQIQMLIEAICIELGCPIRVFKGSERGELASSQDDSDWNERVLHACQTYRSPKVIAPFVDRLVMLGILSEPGGDGEGGYSIEWPEIDATSKKDKAAIALQETQALAAYISGGVEAMIPKEDYMVKVLGWDEEEAKEVVDSAEQAQQDKMDEQGFEPAPPPGFVDPDAPAPPTTLGPGESMHDGETGDKLGQNPHKPPQVSAVAPAAPPGGKPGGVPAKPGAPPPGKGSPAGKPGGTPAPVKNEAEDAPLTDAEIVARMAELEGIPSTDVEAHG